MGTQAPEQCRTGREAKRLGSRVEGGRPWLPVPRAQSGHTGWPARGFWRPENSPGPGIRSTPPLLEELLSSTHASVAFSQFLFPEHKAVFDPHRQPALHEGSLGPPAGSPCTSGCGGSRPPSSGHTPKPAPCSTEHQVGPRASTDHGLTWNRTKWAPVPTIPAHCPLGWDREGRSPLPKALENHRPQWLE